MKLNVNWMELCNSKSIDPYHYILQRNICAVSWTRNEIKINAIVESIDAIDTTAILLVREECGLSYIEPVDKIASSPDFAIHRILEGTTTYGY